MPSIQENVEELEIIKEEQISPVPSVKLRSSKENSEHSSEKTCKCSTAQSAKQTCGVSSTTKTKGTKSVDQDLKEKENVLRAEYDKLLEKKIALARERFNYILQNEQLRACYMLREAHRERQEKIKALESQLECKNLAALMYVVCTERTTSKLEKLRLIEDYTTYINGLQDLLTEAQQLILHLSRGYKTAARVDFEWREKMTLVVGEFMKFIYNFAGGPREMNQYFIDMPNLLKTEAPIVDNPNEDPCESEEVEEVVPIEQEDEKPWWDMMDSNDRPFVMFGDMAEFKPPQRRQVLNTIKAVKAAKTAPQIWKKYVFNEMTLNRSCDNVDDVKDLYPNLRGLSMISERTQDVESIEKNTLGYSKLSLASRRVTQSMDCKGNNDMGSLLKIMTSASMQPKKPPETAALLGARDSIEIHSSTKLKHMNAKSDTNRNFKEAVTLDIGKRYSIGGLHEEEQLEEQPLIEIRNKENEGQKEADLEPFPSGLGSTHHDSMEVIPSHKPEKDHINYERFCPVDRCQRMQVDSFMRFLPPYMRANPFTQFQQTYEDYETCSPEQLEILKQRLEAKKVTEESVQESEPSLKEWVEGGVGTQTSMESVQPPCTCADDNFSPVNSNFVFDLRDLIPVKQALDAIKKECMFDDTIDFDRFKVIGQNSDLSMSDKLPQKNFNQARKLSITKILHKHPSMLDIFQANTRC